MSDKHRTGSPDDAPLNPALKSRKETVYDTKTRSPSPFDSTSAKENEGEGWPIVWLVVVIISVVLAIYFLI